MFLAVDGESSEKVCSYQDVLNYMNLSKSNELFFMTRPVKDHKQATQVSLEVLLYAILDVVSCKSFNMCIVYHVSIDWQEISMNVDWMLQSWLL